MREQGRVRWRRFAAIFITATVAASLLVAAAVQGAVGVSFVVSGRKIKIRIDKLRAFDVVEFDTTLEAKDGRKIPVHVASNRRTEAFGFCQSYLFDTPLGPATFKLTGGTNGEPQVSEGTVLYALRITNDKTISTNVKLGLDASTLESVPGVSGPPGFVGQHTDVIVAFNSQQTLVATTSNKLITPDSVLRVIPGVHECF
ncbi:hypothetical protein DQ384_25180 [Sphaerisporangium album]|uniref:Cholesterol esterase n=1 Tax=Sphaerisporangium album TaxID=509200 RepID=A0A367FBV8_9ACTN|nr:DUF6230 family protein [Sphaerisporangium album]RCG27828.1 hypothetical protein DQ384_25180 [Sphaerisporangium album]